MKLAVEAGKKGKNKGAGKKGGKKGGKKDKGKKGKKEKDLTANRTIESLVEELTETGILQKYSPCKLESFLGEPDLISHSQNSQNFIIPSMTQLKEVLTEYCILPMSLDIKTQTFPKVTSVLLYGSKGNMRFTIRLRKKTSC